jgi:hypothetical protein
MSAHRSTGTWCATMRNTASARAFRPQVTVPASPAPAAAGGAASRTRPQVQATACPSYCVTVAAASGTSMTCRDAVTPRSAAPARSRPHGQAPAGNSGTLSSGSARQARCDPGAPGCFPGRLFPFPRGFRVPGPVLPGRSSADGGIDEFPEFRDSSRSSCASRSSSSATRPASSPFRASRTSISTPCTSASMARSSAAGGTVTASHLPPRPARTRQKSASSSPSVTSSHSQPPPPKNRKQGT